MSTQADMNSGMPAKVEECPMVPGLEAVVVEPFY
jgi:hypothetical protein